MKPAVINIWVDICCLITFIPTLISGLVLFIFFPSGSGRNPAGSTWMDISRHDWTLYHDIAGFAFAILLIIHLLLHLKFFRHITGT